MFSKRFGSLLSALVLVLVALASPARAAAITSTRDAVNAGPVGVTVEAGQVRRKPTGKEGGRQRWKHYYGSAWHSRRTSWE